MEKRGIILLLICLLLVGGIGGCGGSAPAEKSANATKEAAESPKETGQMMDVGAVSFKLADAELRQYSVATDPNSQSNLLALSIEVTNKGSSSEYASACGELSFEDGTKYTFVESTSSMDMGCKEATLTPGTKKTFVTYFLFSDAKDLGHAMPWSKVPGSKIVFSSKQGSGYVRFTIDKSQIRIS